MTGPGPAQPPDLAELSESARALAWDRWKVLAPAVAGEVSLSVAAAAGGVPLRSAQRWLARYRADGLAGLARASRADAGRRRTRPELVALIEGLALRRPRPSVATIARRAGQAAAEHGWAVPAYSTVHAIVAELDPAMVTLAIEGPVAFRDRHELVFRRRADRPNGIWQADHTELDLLILDEAGHPARPWLTVIEDDNSRAVAGYSVFLGAPSALNLSLALRQAIWAKNDPRWAVHGLPDVLYVDHGSDFTSDHLNQVAADLHIRLIYSAVARPHGPG
ncbi:MAG: helix-turn-helix domain-containing protein, partial [Solirubrobacteraceae bacterium]